MTSPPPPEPPAPPASPPQIPQNSKFIPTQLSSILQLSETPNSKKSVTPQAPLVTPAAPSFSPPNTFPPQNSNRSPKSTGQCKPSSSLIPIRKGFRRANPKKMASPAVPPISPSSFPSLSSGHKTPSSPPEVSSMPQPSKSPNFKKIETFPPAPLVKPSSPSFSPPNRFPHQKTTPPHNPRLRFQSPNSKKIGTLASQFFSPPPNSNLSPKSTRQCKPSSSPIPIYKGIRHANPKKMASSPAASPISPSSSGGYSCPNPLLEFPSLRPDSEHKKPSSPAMPEVIAVDRSFAQVLKKKSPGPIKIEEGSRRDSRIAEKNPKFSSPEIDRRLSSRNSGQQSGATQELNLKVQCKAQCKTPKFSSPEINRQLSSVQPSGTTQELYLKAQCQTCNAMEVNSDTVFTESEFRNIFVKPVEDPGMELALITKNHRTCGFGFVISATSSHNQSFDKLKPHLHNLLKFVKNAHCDMSLGVTAKLKLSYSEIEFIRFSSFLDFEGSQLYFSYESPFDYFKIMSITSSDRQILGFGLVEANNPSSQVLTYLSDLKILIEPLRRCIRDQMSTRLAPILCSSSESSYRNSLAKGPAP